MDHVSFSERPTLRNPIIFSAFSGWNDAAGVATAAVRYLIESWSAAKFASIDPEEFYVFTETRPQVKLIGGSHRRVDWPANDFFYHVSHSGTNDYILLAGIEPQLKWKTFSRLILDIAKEFSSSRIVMLGGLLADVAHTRPSRLTGSASDPEMSQRLRQFVVTGSRYQGPTGIVGVLNTTFQENKIPSTSIWGNVPHYLTGIANPRVTRDILRVVGSAFGFSLNLKEFDSAIIDFETQVAEAIVKNPEIADYVRHLEQRDRDHRHESEDEEDQAVAENTPTAENLLKELEDFLRNRRQEDEQDQR